MPSLDLIVEVDTAESVRVKQLSGMFDAPVQEKLRHRWQAELPLDEQAWNVGLIVGPSGSGKSLVARELFGADRVDYKFRWDAGAVVDDFGPDLPIKEITDACSAVGFNTIPSWMKPYRVLSNGEQFRAELARRMLEQDDPIIVDEFTSIVDRQVAKVASHAVQRFVRRRNRQFVAVACHYDIIDWLQPDWVFQPDTCEFQWRSLQPRPTIEIEIARVSRGAWQIFAPFHYMSSSLHKGARCFGLYADGALAVFAGMLPRPISHGKNKGGAIWGISRVVTLPDWQGIGLAFVLMDSIGAAYRALGSRTRMYPAHPGFTRAFLRSPNWRLVKRPNIFTSRSSRSATSTVSRGSRSSFGGRPNAVFEYCGPQSDIHEAVQLIGKAPQ